MQIFTLLLSVVVAQTVGFQFCFYVYYIMSDIII